MTERPDAWKREIALAARMQITLQIAAAYQAAFPERSHGESRSEARLIESSAFATATDHDSYQSCWRGALSSLQDLIHEADDPVKAQDSEVLPARITACPSRAIGPYPQCYHIYSGLCSDIYAAQTADSPKLVAIKLVDPRMEDAPHSIHREIAILKALQHPNIVPLLQHHRVPGLNTTLALVFPYRTKTLADILQSWCTSSDFVLPANIVQQKSLLHDLFSGLAYLHSQDIIHRDIKPSNILLQTQHSSKLHSRWKEEVYTAQLADFGTSWSPATASASDEPSQQKHTDIGTTCYRAPELLFGHRSYGPAVDMWAAGCVAAEVLYASASQTTVAIAPSASQARSHSHKIIDTSARPKTAVVPKGREDTLERQTTTGENESEIASATIGEQTVQASLCHKEPTWTLFTPGPLGSDLALIKSIFETLGTPDATTWPETADATILPDWQKVEFVRFPARSWEGEIVPGVRASAGLDVVRALVCYGIAARARAQTVLQMAYFHNDSIQDG